MYPIIGSIRSVVGILLHDKYTGNMSTPCLFDYLNGFLCVDELTVLSLNSGLCRAEIVETTMYQVLSPSCNLSEPLDN